MLCFFSRPKEIEKDTDAVAYEEAEFGLERQSQDEEVEEDTTGEDVISDGISHIKTSEDCHSATTEEKYICFKTQLLCLAKMKCNSCSTCDSKEIEIIESTIGSALHLKWVKFHLFIIK